MIVIFLFSIFALFLTALESKGRLYGGMKLGMILMTIIAAMRYNYGNDYTSYYDDFTLISKYTFSDILLYQDKMQYIDPAFKDIGAAILYKICEPNGFWGFVALVSAFQGYVFYNFIKENVPCSYYWLAMFVYLFDFNNYLLHMSMIRQALVIALLVWSWHFLRQGKYIIPIIIVVISFTIHKSSVIFAPFLLLNMLSYRNGKYVSIVLVSITAFMWIASSTLGSLLGNVMDMEIFQLYNDSYGSEDGDTMGKARLLLAFIPYVLALYYLIDSQTEYGPRYLVVLPMVSTMILPFSFFIPMISRLCYYFTIFLVAALPLIISQIKSPLVKIPSVVVFVLLTMYQYFDLFLHSVYTDSYATYHTILSAIL